MTESKSKAGRTRAGRFTSGNQLASKAGGPGRPKGQSITAELRRQGDPERIAAYVLSVIDDTTATAKDRLRAAEIVLDRLEGRATQTIDLNAHAAPGVSVDEQAAIDALSDDQLRRLLALDDERRAILADPIDVATDAPGVFVPKQITTHTESDAVKP